MNTTLTLLNDGKNFEQFYYQAICLGDAREAKKLYEQYQAQPTAHFWRDVFESRRVLPGVLLAAIAHVLNMPFGAYMITSRDDARIDITPCLLAQEEGMKTVTEAMTSGDTKALRACARQLSQAADFSAWLSARQTRLEGVHV